MREVLFKAKRKSDGEWVEGLLWKKKYNDGNRIFISCFPDKDDNEEVYVVCPETLCEFTGLYDKNGNRIWENDIVITQPFYDRPYSDKRKSKQFLGIVEYQTSTFNGNKFYPKQVYQGKWGLKYTEEHGKFVYFSWGDLWGCEVIGNRFDNSELLTAERIGENENFS